MDFDINDALNSQGNDSPGNSASSYSKPLEPPKGKLSENDGTPDLSAFESEKKAEKPQENSEKKSNKNAQDLKKKLKVSFKPPKFIENLTKKPENQKQKAQRKKTIVILCSVLAAIILLICAVKIVHYETKGYFEHYENKYNVSYPAGIRKKYCKEYGKDQSFCGTLSIEDSNTDVKVYSKAKKKAALLDRGSDIKQDQHIRAVSLDKSLGDIEKVYKSSDGFLKASQKVEFNTLFDDGEYKVVAAYYTNTDPKDDNGYVFPYNTYGNLTGWSFFQYQDRITTKSLYKTGYKLKRSDYILSISVPTDFMPNFRFVIVCVKNEERKFEKITSTTPNDNIYYPQVWYDKNQKKNPYYLARNWYPEIKVGTNGATKKLTLKDFQ